VRALAVVSCGRQLNCEGRLAGGLPRLRRARVRVSRHRDHRFRRIVITRFAPS
jgi:hypothetical protein